MPATVSLASLFVVVTVFDDDAAEIGDRLEQVLEAVVPVGGNFEEEHDTLVREAELQITDLADVTQQPFGVVDLRRFVVGIDLVADAFDQYGDVVLLEQDLAHGDEGRTGGFGEFDEVLPAVGVFFLEEDRGNFVGDITAHPAHTVASDKCDHVVFERDEIIWLHEASIVAERFVSRISGIMEVKHLQNLWERIFRATF